MLYTKTKIIISYHKTLVIQTINKNSFYNFQTTLEIYYTNIED